MKKLVLIGGKGGTGKSLLALSLLDILWGMGKKVFYVDTVDGVADVYKAVHTSVPCVCSKATPEGLRFIESGLLDDNPDCIVVNTSLPLGDFIAYAHILKDFAALNNLTFTVAWTLDLHRDSLELLHRLVSSGISYDSVVVVMNLFFGQSFGQHFTRYKETEIYKKVSFSLDMPELSRYIAEPIIYDRLPLWADTSGLQIVQRSIWERFRRDIKKNLMPIVV